MDEIRVQKYLSDAGIMSRRAAEKAIERGEIKINGERATIGQKVIDGVDEVRYKGVIVDKNSNRNVYIMLNKPKGFVTTLNDERDRPCIRDLVADLGTRVYPVGRLDMDSEGLLLLTNDGELNNKLTHPRHEIPKFYHVTINSIVTLDQRKALGKPMEIDGYTIKPVRNEVVSQKNDQTTLRLELYEGRNRQIRKMCESLELEILTLRRVAIGNLSLGNLKVGTWRKLNGNEIKYLKTACKMK